MVYYTYSLWVFLWWVERPLLFLVYALGLMAWARKQQWRTGMWLAVVALIGGAVAALSIDLMNGEAKGGPIVLRLLQPLTGSVIFGLGLWLLTRSWVPVAGTLSGGLFLFAAEVMISDTILSGMPVSQQMLAWFGVMVACSAAWHLPVAGSLWWWAVKRRRSLHGAPANIVCSTCRYDVGGLVSPTNCPECGASFARPKGSE